MRLGIQVSAFSWPSVPQSTGRTFRRIALDAEATGMHSLWVMDHFFQISMNGAPEMDMLEGWSALAFAAGATERIALGTLVTGVTYRHPGVLIKTATTLDVLSGGRAYLGIGAAWNEEEHLGLGVPYPPLKERFERLEETLQLAHQMWRDDDSPYLGTHYQLQRPLNHPQPELKPIAAELDLTMAQLAVAWVLSNDNVAAALVGASRPEQVHENVKAAGVQLSPDVLERIDKALGDIVEKDPAKTTQTSPQQRPA